MSSIHFTAYATLGYTFDVNEKLNVYFDIFTIYKIDRLQIYKKMYLYFIYIYLLQIFLNLFVLKVSSFITVNARTDIERTRLDLSFLIVKTNQDLSGR